MQSAPNSTLHWSPDIRITSWPHNRWPIITSTRLHPSQTYLPLEFTWTHSPSKKIRANRHTEKNKNVSNDFQQPCGGKDITFTRICIIEYTRNVCEFLDYVHTTMNNQTNDKILRVPLVLYVHVITYCPYCHSWIPIRTYFSHMLVRWNIRRKFSVSMFVRVSNSGHPEKCTRKTKKLW